MFSELSPRTSPGQVWHPYWVWEDHDAGLYGPPRSLHAEISLAGEVLADPAWSALAMRAVVAEWSTAAEHQLTNQRQNRRAWVGQAACRYAVDAAAISTRMAWPRLSEAQRAAANAAADRVINEWEGNRRG